jgi:lysozyme
MTPSTNLVPFVEGFEGCYLQAYDDATGRIVKPGGKVLGTLTNGFGHTTAAGLPHVYAGQVWTRDYAVRVLMSDLTSVGLHVEHLVRVKLNQCQFDAIVDFEFNTGWLGHEHCSLLIALNRGDYALADEDFMLYDRARGRVLAGLDRRRAAEKALFEQKEYPIGHSA